MRFTDEAIERIDNAKHEWVKERLSRHGMGINIHNDCFGTARVYMNEHYLFDVEDMWEVINELNAMVEIVKDTDGIYEEV